MTTSITTPAAEDYNGWADFWRYDIGSNVIPWNKGEGRCNKVSWIEWQDKPIPQELHDRWKSTNAFKDGIAIIPGICWHKKPFNPKLRLWIIDSDKQSSIDAICTLNGKHITIYDLSKEFIVEKHLDDSTRLHIYGYYESDSPFPNVGSGKICELKCDGKHGIVRCTNSLHYFEDKETGKIIEKGHRYGIIGTIEPSINNAFVEHVLGICNISTQNGNGHGNNNKPSLASTLWKDGAIVNEGENRHVAMLSLMGSLLIRFPGENLEVIFQMAMAKNRLLCNPPLLEAELRKMFDEQCVEFATKKLEGRAQSITAITRQQQAEETEQLEAELASKIPDRDYAEFLIQTSKCTVKQEDSLVRQIIYTVISKDTSNPINLAVMAPTSEGKTYAVQQTLALFPNDDIWTIGSMSSRVMVRQNGIPVDSNNQPIAGRIKELKKKIDEAEKGEKADLEEELRQLYDDAKVLINLQGKLLVFLEPPEERTWDILKPMLSHDSFEIEHPYAYDVPGTGFKVKKVVTRGWPACIFCSAKNESKWPAWPEIQSRFLVTSPNMVRQKYYDGNVLIAQRMGLPSLLQQDLIVSDSQVELAKKSARYILGQVKRYGNKSPVWIPYSQILGRVLPSEKGTDNRITKRIFSFLVIITLARAHLRGRLEYGNESLAIADIDEDLHEVLHITQNLIGIPPFKLRVFREVFLPLYESKDAVNKSEQGNKQEKVIGLTTKELCEHYKEKIGKTIATEKMKKTYLDEFLYNDLIDEVRSELDHRQNIYFPLVDSTTIADNDDHTEDEKITKLRNGDRFRNILQHQRIMVSKNCKIMANNWLELQIFTLLKYGIQLGEKRRFGLYNKHGEQICICKFLEGYHTSDMNRYFSRPIFYNSPIKVVGDIEGLTTTDGEICKKLRNGYRFRNLVISGQQQPVVTIDHQISPRPIGVALSDLLTSSLQLGAHPFAEQTNIAPTSDNPRIGTPQSAIDMGKENLGKGKENNASDKDGLSNIGRIASDIGNGPTDGVTPTMSSPPTSTTGTNPDAEKQAKAEKIFSELEDAERQLDSLIEPAVSEEKLQDALVSSGIPRNDIDKIVSDMNLEGLYLEGKGWAYRRK